MRKLVIIFFSIIGLSIGSCSALFSIGLLGVGGLPKKENLGDLLYIYSIPIFGLIVAYIALHSTLKLKRVSDDDITTTKNILKKFIVILTIYILFFIMLTGII